jgi:hypothetical protein
MSRDALNERRLRVVPTMDGCELARFLSGSPASRPDPVPDIGPARRTGARSGTDGVGRVPASGRFRILAPDRPAR